MKIEISTSNYLQISFIFVAQMFVKSFDSRVWTTKKAIFFYSWMFKFRQNVYRIM